MRVLTYLALAPLGLALEASHAVAWAVAVAVLAAFAIWLYRKGPGGVE